MPYNPTYDLMPFTDFASVTPKTSLSSLNLNWREQDLPERERTKHVHRLHPYLGKFIPQLAEIFLHKFHPKLVCDPFCGSGTTLVEATALGIDSVGCDISEFNCLLTRVKTARYDINLLEHEIEDILTKLNLQLHGGLFSDNKLHFEIDSKYLKTWFHPKALKQLLCYRSLISNYQYQDVLKVILSRAARSSRLTTHYELDWPKKPQTEPYHCFKHGHTCQPTDDALQFLNRYSLDTLKRIKEFHKRSGKRLQHILF
ncbi:MAG: DNA methyltransferase [Nitrospirota bacterium]